MTRGDGINDYNVLIGLRAWIHDERSHTDVRARILEQINETFQREGVEMPLETIQLAPFTIQKEPLPERPGGGRHSPAAPWIVFQLKRIISHA